MKSKRNKRRKHNTLFIVALMILFIVSSCKSNDNTELYEDLLGKPKNHCVKVVTMGERQKFDGPTVHFYFILCPTELKRILAQRDYDMKVIVKSEMLHNESLDFGNPDPKWWTPSKLGDSCFMYTYFAQDIDRAEHLYVSIDSTKAYYRDDRF
ncbi:MAG TPA: hypothetical protein VK484_10440 [Ferruginibacter sp.]|nr:hypothetical protein [Ferruginibacter sp.]